jgi:hypothetical protein
VPGIHRQRQVSRKASLRGGLSDQAAVTRSNRVRRTLRNTPATSNPVILTQRAATILVTFWGPPLGADLAPFVRAGPALFQPSSAERRVSRGRAQALSPSPPRRLRIPGDSCTRSRVVGPTGSTATLFSAGRRHVRPGREDRRRPGQEGRRHPGREDHRRLGREDRRRAP